MISIVAHILSGNQQLFNWTEDLLKKRETMFDTGNLANY